MYTYVRMYIMYIDRYIYIYVCIYVPMQRDVKSYVGVSESASGFG